MTSPGTFDDVPGVLASLGNLATALAAADSPAAVAEATATTAVEIFGADGALVAELRADGSALDVAAAAAVPENFRAVVQRAGFGSVREVDRLRRGPVRTGNGIVGVPLVRGGTVVGALLLGYDGAPRSPAHCTDVLTAVAAQCALSLGRARLLEAERITREHVGLLIEAGSVLAGHADVEATLDRLAQLVVPRLADWCSVHLREARYLRQVAFRHRDPAAAGAVAELLGAMRGDPDLPYGPAAVAASGRTSVLPPISDEILVTLARGDVSLMRTLRQVRVGAGIVVPLIAADRTLGSLTLVREGGPDYRPAEVEVAEELGTRAGLAVDAAIAHRRLRDAFLERDAAAEIADLERDRLTALVQQLPVGVVLADAPSGRIRLRNSASERIWPDPLHQFGTVGDYARLLGRRPDGGVIAAQDWPLARTLRTGEEVRSERLEITWPTGRRATLEVSAGPVRDRIGRVVAGVAVFNDVSDRVASEAALARSEQRANAMAHTLQASLLPPALPDVPGLELAAAYRPVGQGVEVGGDFYDVTETAREDEWAVVIGDVCGKGAPAAAVTALARYTVRAAALRARRPAVILRQLNEVMLRHAAERPFLTAVYASLRHLEDEAAPYRLTVAVGGHPLPVLLHADGKVETVGRPGSLIGVLEDADFADETVLLARGDVLLLYTDGLTEARRGKELFGEQRLLDALPDYAGSSAADLIDGLQKQVLDFSAGRQRDDVALFALRVG